MVMSLIYMIDPTGIYQMSRMKETFEMLDREPTEAVELFAKRNEPGEGLVGQIMSMLDPKRFIDYTAAQTILQERENDRFRRP